MKLKFITLKRIILFVFTGLFVLALFPRCAKVVAPSGGPKDTIAPFLVNSVPRINATNFNGNEIIFEFNEYVQLKDLQQKLLVSPPLKYRPQVKPKGKKVEIELTDTLKPNTTYTVYLGDAISDNNEGNPIKSFEFAFSTGSAIDTLSLQGTVVNSFTKKPVDGALIMLYSSFVDSLPYTHDPTHIAKTNKQGEFRVNNLKFLDYKLLAITDLNSNYKYNQGVEEIAFYDQDVKKDQLIDTAKSKIELRLFTEILPQQIITSYNRPQRRALDLNFSRKPVGEITLSLIDEPLEHSWYVTERHNQGDTVKIWITSDRIAQKDTLKILALYQKTDSLNILHPQQDTLKLVFLDKEKSVKPASKEKDVDSKAKVEHLNISLSIKNGGVAKPDVPVELTLPMPAKNIDPSKIKIFNETDSIMESSVTLVKDSLNPRVYRFNKEWKSAKAYKMLILDGTFESLETIKNDTIKLAFTGADPEKFGTLIIKPENVTYGIIVELLADKENVVATKASVGNKPISFTFIEPGKYRLRFTEDINLNGIWDTGNYLKKVQPERVFEFTEGKSKGEINIRANWENEIKFSIPKP